MIKNYLISGFRAQKRHKWFTLLNIFGLTIGITTALFILSYVREDFRWDRFVEKGDRLYRLIQVQTFNPDTEDHTPFTMPAIGPAMQENIAGVEAYVRTTGLWQCNLQYDEVTYKSGYRYVEKSLFEVFDYPLILGNRETALERPESIVITEKISKKIFGNENPMGKSLIIDGKRECIVTGVMGKPETETHFEQEVIVPFESIMLDMAWVTPEQLNSWGWFNFFTYILLEEGANIADVNEQLPAFFEEHYDLTKQNFYLQPFFDIHLKSTAKMRASGTNSTLAAVYGLLIIAGFILLIACINFINMSTAQSMKRSREVGMRKVAGATRDRLVFQFLTESMMIAFIAMILAAVLVEVCEPWFQQICGREIAIDIFDRGFTTFSLLGLTIVTGLLSGLYPAIVMSSPAPVQIFKGGLNSHKAPWIRRGLVVLQFTISIVLLISTSMIYKQVHYLKNKSLGYNKEGVLLLYMSNDAFKRNLDDNLAQIEAIPGVQATTCCNKFPGRLGNITGVTVPENPEAVMVHDMVVTPGFEKVYQCELVEGRFIDKDLPTDQLRNGTGSVIVNETAVDLFGWENPIGQSIRTNGCTANVIGVVKDFHFTSLHSPIEPMIIVSNRGWLNWVAIRFDTDDTVALVNKVESIWKDVVPNMPFDYMFLDEFYDNLYRDETQQGRIFNIFAGIAIFIACLGLLGLAAYATNTRAREISVRKVLGASVRQILVLISREYFWMVLVATLLATPVASYFMHKWLSTFAYTTAMSWWVFVLSGVAALAIALLTVAGQAAKAALTNPAKALRHE